LHINKTEVFYNFNLIKRILIN